MTDICQYCPSNAVPFCRQSPNPSLSQTLCVLPANILHPSAHPGSQDLVFIEEAFERLLLDYDRVFSAMAIPACLWRRTGEIYKANREFAELVGVDGYMLRDVSLACHFTHVSGDLMTRAPGSPVHL